MPPVVTQSLHLEDTLEENPQVNAAKFVYSNFLILFDTKRPSRCLIYSKKTQLCLKNFQKPSQVAAKKFQTPK